MHQLSQHISQSDSYTPPRQPGQTEIETPPLPSTGSNAHCATLLGVLTWRRRRCPFRLTLHTLVLVGAVLAVQYDTTKLGTPYSWYAVIWGVFGICHSIVPHSGGCFNHWLPIWRRDLAHAVATFAHLQIGRCSASPANHQCLSIRLLSRSSPLLPRVFVIFSPRP
ncbi:hypothetical protein CI102_14050 [Trichoderma harzianum]|nr:hypothetical protein CI102_14050 [Trichoderma harzianum]